MSERWTRDGRRLLLDGKPAIYIDRIVEPKTANSVLPPVVCDAIADAVCNMLNATDLDKLRADWMAKP